MYRDHPESKTLSHVLKDDMEATKWFRKSALQGYAEAQYALGQKYAYGVGKDDKVEATKWFRKAAEQGHNLAQYMLGQIYANGEGVTENDKEAMKWWHKAAEQGHALAQITLRGNPAGC
jgi:TPR repeat protein